MASWCAVRLSHLLALKHKAGSSLQGCQVDRSLQDCSETRVVGPRVGRPLPQLEELLLQGSQAGSWMAQCELGIEFVHCIECPASVQ